MFMEVPKTQFNSVKDLNWAWLYQRPDSTWIQFDCTECLNLEYSYHAYQISGKDIYRNVNIVNGTVDIQNMTMKVLNESNVEKCF